MMANVKAKITQDKQEFPECEYANSKIKELEELEHYIKKQIKISSKIVDAIQTAADQMGLLAELQRQRISKIQGVDKEDQALSVNYLLFMQGNFIVLRDELSKGYSYQNELLSSEIQEVKGTFNKNLRKPLESIETMSIMHHQLNKMFKTRNKVIQRHQYHAFHVFNTNYQNFGMNNGNIYTAMNQISDLQIDITNTPLRSVHYVGRTLGEILDSEGREHSQLPSVVEEIINIIQNKFIDQEGIFRTAGSQKVIQDIANRLSVSDVTELSMENITGLLKKFVRDLPGMLFCNSLAKNMLSKFLESQQRNERIKNLQSLFYSPKWVPEEKIVLFKAIMLLCHKIAQHQEVNKMTEKNLAVCWTPSMFAVSQDEISNYLDMVSFIIEESEFIFEDKRIVTGGKTTPRGNWTSSGLSTGLPTTKVSSAQTFNFMDSPLLGTQTQSTPAAAAPPQPPSNVYTKPIQNDPTKRYQLHRGPPTKSLPTNPPPKMPPTKPQRNFFQPSNHAAQQQTDDGF